MILNISLSIKAVDNANAVWEKTMKIPLFARKIAVSTNACGVWFGKGRELLNPLIIFTEFLATARGYRAIEWYCAGNQIGVFTGR